jgi:hypothetical protein
MIIRMGNAFFSAAGSCRIAVAATALAAVLAVGGCGGGGAIEDAAPVAQGARDTGTYPNLNIKPEVAATQFTDAERDTKLSELKAVRVRAAASPGVTTEAADAAALNKLAKSHAGDTLKQLEGKCDPALDPTCK